MKFTNVSLLGIVTLLMLFVSVAAWSADEDLPPPLDGVNQEELENPPAQEDLDDALPTPTLGSDEENLPDSWAGPQEQDKYKVNNQAPNDQVYLPQAANQDSVYYAPLGNNPTYSRDEIDRNDWRMGMENRPMFSLHAGGAVFSYPSTAVQENREAITVGASVRVFNLAQTVFLHAYGSYSWVGVGPVGPFPNVKDTVLHLGGLLEVGVGRRVSIFGSLLRRAHTLSADTIPEGQFQTIDSFTNIITNEGWKIGVGAQYDFYVIPHGSIGIRGHLEQDMLLIALTMALEPQPKRRMTLNFD
jgi:hypothetical protein